MQTKHISHKKTSMNRRKSPKRIVPQENPLEVLDRDVHAPDNVIVTSEEANKPVEDNFSFFARLWSIPIVHESTFKAQEIANRFAISRFAMNQVEFTLRFALNLTIPYVQKYKDQLMKADKLGCQSLDIVESKLPSGTVLYSPQKVYKDVVTYTNESVEQWVNKYLPQEKNDVDNRSSSNKENTSLANEVKNRLAYRAKTDLSRLVETSRLLQEMLTSIQKANDRLQDFVNSLKGGYNSTQTKANVRLHELTVDLIKRVDAAADYAKDHHITDHLPWVVHPLVDLTSSEYGIIRTEMLKSDLPPLKKATNILHVNQSYLLPLIRNSIQELQAQIREYSLNNKVVREVRSTLGLVGANA